MVLKNNYKLQITNNKNAGFTLVEVLVALAIFSIIASLAIGIFVMAMRSQRKILAQQQVLDQVSYAIEYMSRAIRMARKDDITIGGVSVNCLFGDRVNYEITAIGTGHGGIKFRNYNNDCPEFYLQEGQLREDKNGVDLPLTAPDLTVISFEIKDSGWDQYDTLQPAVTMFLDIEGKEGTKIQIQTTVSQRNLDVRY
ncbi:MAG: prepilin-type N-terminal cleavage/methylation domain-containing protein [bacterium]